MYDILNSALRYDPATGQFWWRNPGRKRRMHEPAGSLTAAGFVLISVAGYRFLGHRLAWMLTHKTWPASNLEHINGDRTDNRIENLREVTRSETVHNTGMWDSNTSGIKGVAYYPYQRGSNKWLATATVNGKRRQRWCATQEDAVAARQAFMIR
jgi:hypothetical protein